MLYSHSCIYTYILARLFTLVNLLLYNTNVYGPLFILALLFVRSLQMV